MGYGGGDFTAAGCPGGGRAAALSLCAGCELWADRPGGWFSDDSALEVCKHEMRYTNRRSYLFTFSPLSLQYYYIRFFFKKPN